MKKEKGREGQRDGEMEKNFKWLNVYENEGQEQKFEYDTSRFFFNNQKETRHEIGSKICTAYSSEND